MAYDLLVRGGVLVQAEGERRADLAVHEGRIVALGLDLDGAGARRVLDVDGALLLPGGVDPHVHLALPVAGLRSADDFASGSAEAALGGCTCYLDFVTPRRGQSLLEAYRERRAEAEGQSYVDFGLHMSVTGWHAGIEEEIAASVALGLPTFKTYLAYLPTFGVDDGTLFRTLRAVGQHGGMVLVHAVNGPVYEALVEDLVARGRLDPAAHPLAQPPLAEAEATARALRLAEIAGQPLYVVHVTCREALAELQRAQARGLPVYGETCPQYLLLDESLYELPPEEAVRYVLSPPLRARSHQEALWQGLRGGTLEVVATDHCPFVYAGGKDRGLQDFRKIPNGLAGLRERMDLLHSAGVLTGRLSRSRWVELLSTGPARRMGLYPQKGSLLPGADADLVVYDPSALHRLGPRPAGGSRDHHVYAGREVQGRCVHVFSRGQQVVAEGQLVDGPALGRFTPRRLGSGRGLAGV